MYIEFENILRSAFNDGINLFLGAGFSLLSKDKSGCFLPTGNGLRDELSKKFKIDTPFSLSQISSLLQATNKTEYYDYLKNRFSVESYSDLYHNLFNINIKTIYTTNIDNLIFQIYQSKNNDVKYIHDQFHNGPVSDEQGINYMPLHGCVAYEESNYVFDVAALANIYSEVPHIWNSLIRDMELRPTIFIGYGFNDSSVIQAVTSQRSFRNTRKDMWIVLHQSEYANFYKAMGFHVIEADIEQFLKYLDTFIFKGRTLKRMGKNKVEYLKPYLVPRNIQEIDVQRPIRDFYGGSSPYWCDIMSNHLYKTNYFTLIMNSVMEVGAHTLIVGAPVAGKTTLLMQVAYNMPNNFGEKFYFDILTKERAEFILKIVGTDRVTIFINNLADSIEAVGVLLQKNNIKIVGAERSHNYGIVSHLIDESRFNIINVSILSDFDLQGLFNALPPSIRAEKLHMENRIDNYAKDSLFEFVIRNVNYHNIKDRYRDAILKMEKEDYHLAEFLVLCAYMHSSHIPLSFEMAYSYFNGKYENVNFNDIFTMRSDASDIIHDYIPKIRDKNYETMDYYYPRSRYIAEVILNSCSSYILKEVLSDVLNYIPKFQICDYHIFRKFAFDKLIISKAFKNVEEGQLFYENAFVYDDKNPYVLQQGALYLAQKKCYEKAFEWIDQALSMTDDKYFSIRNSHAIILFNANINKIGNNSRIELDKSMSILKNCMNADKRKRFHALTYGLQALKYFEKYPDQVAVSYLEQALTWLKVERLHCDWDINLKRILNEISCVLSSI